MRVVLDTNTLVSGVISPSGPPRRLLDGLRAQVFESCSSATLLAELLDVLSREKFAARLAQAGLTPQGIVAELRRMAYMVAPQAVPRVIEHDADDDYVLACALAGRADLIVSGDKHLHRLGGHYSGTPSSPPLRPSSRSPHEPRAAAAALLLAATRARRGGLFNFRTHSIRARPV